MLFHDEEIRVALRVNPNKSANAIAVLIIEGESQLLLASLAPEGHCCKDLCDKEISAILRIRETFRVFGRMTYETQ